MDFTFTEAQLAVEEAARGIFEGRASAERCAEIEATADRIDRDLWAELARADLLGIAVPERFGGAGLGLTELCLVLRAQGQRVAPVPLWATSVLGALPIARFGSEEIASTVLPGMVRGEVLLTAACASAALGALSVDADAKGRLFGAVPAVPHGHVADAIVVPARAPDGRVVLALVDPRRAGVMLERAVTTNLEIHPHLQLDGAPSQLLVGPEDGAAALAWLLDAAWTALSALALGVAESALEQTAAYLNQREQFGRPLSTFQATMLRAADAAIDIEAMRVTCWQAAWRIDAGRDASAAVAVAKWQAAERGQRVVHATQHLHGGIGADTSYPIHRYFLWGKQIELLLGGPSVHLHRLGEAVALQARARAGVHP